MKIITDNGMDLAPEIVDKLDIEVVALTITLDDKHYKGGVDIDSDTFYAMLRASSDFPVTSQPSPGDFDTLYSHWIEHDPDIISIHMSQHLSGTVNAARLGADLTKKKGANVTVIDSKTISGPLGWQVEAAARAANAGWQRDKIVDLTRHVNNHTRVVFSPETLKYLINGGRVSHLQGFAANMLNIKPVLQVDGKAGKIESISRVRTLRKAVAEQVKVIEREVGAGTALRVQIEHADNEEMASLAHDLMSQTFRCDFLPTTSITPLVGAHTGPGAIAIAYAPQSAFDEVP